MDARRACKLNAAVALFLCASLAFGQETDAAKTAVLDDKSARELRDHILAEAATLPNHPWAGEYHCGDGIIRNQRLLLAPEAGFLIEWSGCSGLYYRNCGPIKEQDGTIRLCFTLKNEGEFMAREGLPDEFVLVDWKPSQYLVPANDLLGFCNTVNQGHDPSNQGSLYFLRGEERGGLGAGLPQVPEEFQSYLLPVPVTAEIISIDAVTTRPRGNGLLSEDTTVTLNAGKDKGLREGMRMYVERSEGKYGSFLITSVGESSSKAVTTGRVHRASGDNSGPEKGWQLSTRRL